MDAHGVSHRTKERSGLRGQTKGVLAAYFSNNENAMLFQKPDDFKTARVVPISDVPDDAVFKSQNFKGQGCFLVSSLDSSLDS